MSALILEDFMQHNLLSYSGNHLDDNTHRRHSVNTITDMLNDMMKRNKRSLGCSHMADHHGEDEVEEEKEDGLSRSNDSLGQHAILPPYVENTIPFHQGSDSILHEGDHVINNRQDIQIDWASLITAPVVTTTQYTSLFSSPYYTTKEDSTLDDTLSVAYSADSPSSAGSGGQADRDTIVGVDKEDDGITNEEEEEGDWTLLYDSTLDYDAEASPPTLDLSDAPPHDFILL